MMMGKVVDMFYFHCFMVPFPIGFHYGVESRSYPFHPYLTSLTLCISVGVFAILLAFRKDFNGWTPVKEAKVD